jgi:O-acetyl-ADP-ribose deacetylase (regulator of RNase III)
VIIHGCNAKGVMGSGFAKQLKETYPKAFEVYRQYFDAKYNRLGDTSNHVEYYPKVSGVSQKTRLIIINAITQLDYRKPTDADQNKVHVDYQAIGSVFKKASDRCTHYGLLDLHFPKIGAGLAGGDWDEIQKIIDRSCHRTVRKHLWVLPEST